MSELANLFQRVERDLQRRGTDAEQSHPAALWRRLVQLRERAEHGDTSDAELVGAARELASETGGDTAEIPADRLVQTLDAAIRAPSLHNSQPWRFAVGAGHVDVRLDPARQLDVADPDRSAARLACGAAIHNLTLAFPVLLRRDAAVTLLPDRADPDLIARIRPGRARPATPHERAGYAAIGRRRTNRYPFRDDTPVHHGHHWTLSEAARTEHGWLTVITEATRRRQIAAMVADADTALSTNAAYRAELASWVRPDAETTDGVPPAAAGIRSEDGDLLRGRDYGGRTRRPGRDFEAEPLLAVIGGAGDRAVDEITVGRALQAVLLAATEAGLAVSVYSQPFEVPAVRARMRRFTDRLGTPYLVLRIGYASRPSPATPRRPVETVTDLR
ncbi:MAG TPA: nitroreductase [Actinocatenispora sp.]